MRWVPLHLDEMQLIIVKVLKWPEVPGQRSPQPLDAFESSCRLDSAEPTDTFHD